MVRRPIALLLLFTLVPQFTGCAIHTVTGVRPEGLRPEERGSPGDPRLVGVVTQDVNGEIAAPLTFDSAPPARYARDTLVAFVGGRQVMLRRRDILAVTVARQGMPDMQVVTSNPQHALEVARGHQRIVGVTPRGGDEVRFDPGRAAYVAADTLHGVVAGAPYAIAMGAVSKVLVVRANAALTALVWVPGVVVGLVMVAAVGFGVACGGGSNCIGM